MNLKKYIRQKSEEDAEKLISESDEQFCRAIAEQSVTAPQARVKTPKHKLWVWLSSAAAVAAAAVMTTVVLVNNRPIYYQQDVFNCRTATMEQLQADSKYFSICEPETPLEEVQITVAHDIETDDKLCYFLDSKYEVAEANLAEVNLTIVVNKHYHHYFNMDDYNTVKLSEYTVDYETGYNELIIPCYCYRGRIKVKTETVYFEYKLLRGFDDEIFINEIQKLVQLKK